MKRLFIDMDNVIADYSSAAQAWFEKELAKISYSKRTDIHYTMSIKDYKHYEILTNYGFTDEHEIKRLNWKMWKTPGFWENMSPVTNALNTIRRLMDNYDVFIITKPVLNNICITEKADWVQVHLYTLYPDKVCYMSDKSILSDGILVDDNPNYLQYYKGECILFTQPYNIASAGEYYIANNWKELEKMLNEII